MGIFGGDDENKELQEAAQAIEFKPVGLDLAGVGGVGEDFSLTLPEEVRAIQDNLFGQSGAALDASGSLVGAQKGAGEQLFGAGADALRSLGTFDPLEAAATQFQNLESILNPIRERETAGLEARLARQGILTGTAGAQRLGERSASIERERGLSLLNQFQSAQQAQQNLANLGINLTGAGAGQRESLFGTGVGAVQAGQGVSTPLMNLLGLSMQGGEARTAAQTGRATALASAEAAGGGGSGLGEGLGGLVGGFAGSFLGPLGTAAGTAIGSKVGGMFTGK